MRPGNPVATPSSRCHCSPTDYSRGRVVQAACQGDGSSPPNLRAPSVQGRDLSTVVSGNIALDTVANTTYERPMVDAPERWVPGTASKTRIVCSGDRTTCMSPRSPKRGSLHRAAVVWNICYDLARPLNAAQRRICHDPRRRCEERPPAVAAGRTDHLRSVGTYLTTALHLATRRCSPFTPFVPTLRLPCQSRITTSPGKEVAVASYRF